MAHKPVERQLADEGAVTQLAAELTAGAQHGYQNGQVIDRPLLADIGGREVDRQPALRERKAAVFDRGAHSVLRLIDCGVGQADQIDPRQPLTEIHLDPDHVAVNAEKPHAVDTCKHPTPPYS